MKNEKKRTLKGAVLFTVISVLALLIIMMTCTLAMAAAANKRSRKTYSSSQSSYTARTAIDSILAAVGTDKNFSKAIRELKVGDEMDVIVELNNPSMGSINNAKIKHAGTKQVFDPDEKVKAWVTRNLYTITADVTVGGETTTITSSVLQDPPVNVTVKRNNGAPFLTYGTGTGAGNFMSSWGGTYFGMGDWTPDGVATSQKWQNALLYNEHNVGTGQIITLADKKYLSGLTYEYPNNNDVSTPFVVNGNLKLTTGSHLYYTRNGSGVSNPGVQVWGDMEMSNANFRFKASDELVKFVKTDDFRSIPYLYVDGTIKYGVDTILGIDGKTNIPFNVFCGNIWGTDGKITGYSNLYCMDVDKTSHIKVSSDGKLYKWVSATVKREWSDKYEYVGGNLYSNGNVVIAGQKLNAEGGVYVNGDFALTGDGADIGGEVVVGGRLIIMQNLLQEKDGHYELVNGKVEIGNKIYVNKNEIYKCTGYGAVQATQEITYDGLEKITLESDKIQEITDASNGFTGDIYPKNATREALIGAHWYIKGIEGRVIPLSEASGVDFGTQVGGTPDLITGNYVLSGDISKEVTIRPGKDQTIYVKLKDVNFACNKDDKGESKNDAKITVDESAENSHVYFVIEGFAISDYDFDNDYDDIAQTKLVKTVYELMNEFKLEDIDKTPPTGGKAPTIETRDKYTTDQNQFLEKRFSNDVELTGDWKNCQITIEAPKEGDDPRWVVLGEGFEMSNNQASKIIIDDTGDKKGEVDIFIRNDVKLQGANDQPVLVTQTFLNMLNSGKKIYMFSDNDLKMQYAVCDANGKVLKYTADGTSTGAEIQVFDNLNVYIHSPKDKVVNLDVGNQNYITAYAQAINLNLNVGAQATGGLQDKIVYDMQPLNTVQNCRVGWIGLLDIKGFTVGNGWTFLYVPMDDGNSGGGGGGGNVQDAEGKHAYAAVEYNAFLN